MEILVRPETEPDLPAIDAVNQLAFDRPDEAQLVNRLRQGSSFDPNFSLVAVADGRVVGHILFTPVTIEGQPVNVMALGPMAVHPDFQNQGIGSALVYQGLEALRKKKVDALMVLGHPEFYPRFGFVPASQFNLRCKWTVPDEVFMAQELRSGALENLGGLVEYDPAFDEV